MALEAIFGACSYSVHILFIHSSIFNKSLDMIDLYNQTIENNKDVSRYWFTNNFFITCQVREYLASSLFGGLFFAELFLMPDQDRKAFIND